MPVEIAVIANGKIRLKNPALEDSPPAADRISDRIPMKQETKNVLLQISFVGAHFLFHILIGHYYDFNKFSVYTYATFPLHANS